MVSENSYLQIISGMVQEESFFLYVESTNLHLPVGAIDLCPAF